MAFCSFVFVMVLGEAHAQLDSIPYFRERTKRLEAQLELEKIKTKEASDQNQQLASEIQRLKNINSGLERNITELNSEKENLNRTIKNQKEQLAKTKINETDLKKIPLLNARVDSLKRVVTALEKKYTTADEFRKSAESSKDIVQKMFEKEAEKVENLKAEVDSLMKSLATTQAEVRGERQKVTLAQKRDSAATVALAELEKIKSKEIRDKELELENWVKTLDLSGLMNIRNAQMKLEKDKAWIQSQRKDFLGPSGQPMLYAYLARVEKLQQQLRQLQLSHELLEKDYSGTEISACLRQLNQPDFPFEWNRVRNSQLQKLGAYCQTLIKLKEFISDNDDPSLASRLRLEAFKNEIDYYAGYPYIQQELQKKVANLNYRFIFTYPSTCP